MAEDKKTSIDLKTLTPSDLVGLLKSAFGNGNKVGVFIALAFITSFVLIYLIFGKLDNQTLYDIQLAKHSQASADLATLTKKLNKTIKDNKVYFSQLFSSPKTDDELSAKVTKLVSNYNLKLLNMDLQKSLPKTKELGVAIEVSGTYNNLLKFCNELNKNVAASQILSLDVEKKDKTRNLEMKVVIKFAAPPNPNSIPKLKPPTVGNNAQKFQATLLGVIVSNTLDFIVSEAVANEADSLSSFERAYDSARKQGLYEFSYILSSGETKTYLTGLPKVPIVALSEATQQINNSILPPLQSANSKVLNSQAIIKRATNKEAKFNKANLMNVGFVEVVPTKEGKADEEGGTDRDPFEPPEVKKAAKRKSSGMTSEAEEEQFYLSGIMISEEMNLCIIQTPEGEFKIYGEGEKVSNNVVLTGIRFDSIEISKNNKTKVISFGQQVN